MEFKKLSDVEKINNIPQDSTVLINDSGVIKQCKASSIKSSSGGGSSTIVGYSLMEDYVGEEYEKYFRLVNSSFQAIDQSTAFNSSDTMTFGRVFADPELTELLTYEDIQHKNLDITFIDSKNNFMKTYTTFIYDISNDSVQNGSKSTRYLLKQFIPSNTYISTDSVFSDSNIIGLAFQPSYDCEFNKVIIETAEKSQLYYNQ